MAGVAGYVGHLEKPRGDNFGVALYARAPLEGSIEELGSPLPSVVTSVTVGDARLSLLLIHPPPPINEAALTAQIEELDAVADRARQLPGPVVIMGDFNATPWSRPFRRVLARSGLCDSRTGFGIEASFPAALPSCGFRSIMCSCRARSACVIATSSETSARIICPCASTSSCHGFAASASARTKTWRSHVAWGVLVQRVCHPTRVERLGGHRANYGQG